PERARGASVGAGAGGAAPTPPRLASTDHSLAAGAGVRLVPRTIEQANLVLGCAGLSRTDDDRFALGVLNAALGGGMSSRLFQEGRGKRGLAYSVYSFASQHSDSGMWATYIGCLPAKADEVLAICQEEIAKVISGGLTGAELDRGKGQLRGSLVLGLEDPSSRMSRLGKSELVYSRLEPVDEILACIEAVTHDDVRRVAGQILGRPKGLAVVGPVDDDAPLAAAPGCPPAGPAPGGRAGSHDQSGCARREGAHGLAGMPGGGRRGRHGRRRRGGRGRSPGRADRMRRGGGLHPPRRGPGQPPLVHRQGPGHRR